MGTMKIIEIMLERNDTFVAEESALLHHGASSVSVAVGKEFAPPHQLSFDDEGTDPPFASPHQLSSSSFAEAVDEDEDEDEDEPLQS